MKETSAFVIKVNNRDLLLLYNYEPTVIMSLWDCWVCKPNGWGFLIILVFFYPYVVKDPVFYIKHWIPFQNPFLLYTSLSGLNF